MWKEQKKTRKSRQRRLGLLLKAFFFFQKTWLQVLAFIQPHIIQHRVPFWMQCWLSPNAARQVQWRKAHRKSPRRCNCGFLRQWEVCECSSSFWTNRPGPTATKFRHPYSDARRNCSGKSTRLAVRPCSKGLKWWWQWLEKPKPKPNTGLALSLSHLICD